MAIPETLQIFLSNQRIPYSLVTHRPTRRIQRAAAVAGLDPAHVARAVLMCSDDEEWLVVLPCDRLIHFPALEAVRGESAEVRPVAEPSARFADCHPNMTPTVGPAWGLPTIVDARLFELDEIALGIGRDDRLIRVDRQAFEAIFAHCDRAPISQPLQGEGVAQPASPPERGSEDVLGRLYALPPMPHTAMEILRLSSDPAACADDLVRLVNQDPSLAAQIVRYARSPLFGRGGDVQAVEDAVHRVLGFDMVVSVAVGLATARIFRNPAGGPLGLNAFWQHATYTATLSQEFARHMPSDRRPPLGLAYLAGLLHNVGFLVLGHLFRPEFEILNRLVAVSPRSRVTDVERQVLAMGEARRAIGMGHARLGAVLMERWEMPEGVRIAVAEHHNPDYAGPHAEIAALVLLADRLTRRLALGDGDSEHLPERLLMRLGLSGDTLEAVFDRFLGVREGLDSMARRIAA